MRGILLLAGATACGEALTASPARAADAKSECSVAADRGQSLRDEGRYRLAREAFATCSHDACWPVIARFCTQWLREIDDATPTVVLGAKDERGADVSVVRVTFDGALLTKKLDGKPLQLDPGAHVLRFERDGSPAAEVRVLLRTGERNRLVNVTLHSPSATTEGSTSAGEEPSDHAVGTEAPQSILWERNLVALSLLGLTVATVIGGAYFLAQSNSDSRTAAGIRGALPPNACSGGASSPTCLRLGDAVDAEHRDSTAATGMFVGSVALAAAAVATWVMWPHPDDASKGATRIAPSVAAGRWSIDVTGSF